MKGGLTQGFLIRSYDAPHSAGRCPVAQCYDKTWATLVQSKIKGPVLLIGNSSTGCWQLTSTCTNENYIVKLSNQL